MVNHPPSPAPPSVFRSTCSAEVQARVFLKPCSAALALPMVKSWAGPGKTTSWGLENPQTMVDITITLYIYVYIYIYAQLYMMKYDDI
jgi:hypothetical protein